MAKSEKQRWESWAAELRRSLMCALEREVTKTVEEIAEETGTSKSLTVLSSKRFWNSCQSGKSPNGAITSAGFEINFAANGQNSVEAVTLNLNETWSGIMQRVLDRR